MAFLEIKGTDYEAKASYKFAFTANEKHKIVDDKGNETASGVMNIYNKLLEEDVLYLSYFWDCALSHHKKKPSLSDIQEALEDAAGEDEDYLPLFQEAYQMLDNSGFFRGQVKKFWNQAELMKEFGKNEQEKAAMEAEVKSLKQARKELNPSTD